MENTKITKESKLRHTVVVYSGSTCMCGVLQHTSSECGHLHKTLEAAEKCQSKLIGYSNGSCSAEWAYSKIELRDSAGDVVVHSYDYDHDTDTYTEILDYADDLCSC